MISNRDIERLYDQWNPNNVMVGDRVKVRLLTNVYTARIVGLSLDIKNKKVYADLRLQDTRKKFPTRVDVSDCYRIDPLMYPSHHGR